MLVLSVDCVVQRRSAAVCVVVVEASGAFVLELVLFVFFFSHFVAFLSSCMCLNTNLSSTPHTPTTKTPTADCARDAELCGRAHPAVVSAQVGAWAKLGFPRFGAHQDDGKHIGKDEIV